MNSVILPSFLLPNIQYFQILMQFDHLFIEAHETYPKQTFRNRYEIAGPNGRQRLTVPVAKTVKGNCPMDLVMVSYDQDWSRLHWRSIVTAYNSSPYFLYYRDEFEDIFFKKHDSLVQMNLEFLRFVFKILKLKITIEFTSTFMKDFAEADYRIALESQHQLHENAFTEYYQVFGQKNGFLPNLSILDLIFNLGPEALTYIKRI